MEGVMNFGCILAEEERSQIEFSGGMAGRKLGPRVVPVCQFRLAVYPLLILKECITQLIPRHLAV